ncbi:hypothetical protein PT974_05619 [Cladobotryum mycophilum]|uniref:BZIP domain-containing protein n=1 Tax=Cladobotryum mycophilum TaxID=491253 RepID=A0ABR0SJC2_9HYPO
MSSFHSWELESQLHGLSLDADMTARRTEAMTHAAKGEEAERLQFRSDEGAFSGPSDTGRSETVPGGHYMDMGYTEIVDVDQDWLNAPIRIGEGNTNTYGSSRGRNAHRAGLPPTITRFLRRQRANMTRVFARQEKKIASLEERIGEQDRVIESQREQLERGFTSDGRRYIQISLLQELQSRLSVAVQGREEGELGAASACRRVIDERLREAGLWREGEEEY